MNDKKTALIIGAGPAGLTAALSPAALLTEPARTDGLPNSGQPHQNTLQVLF